MSHLLGGALGHLIMPPGAIVILLLLILYLMPRRPRLSRFLLLGAIAIIYLTSIPAMSILLHESIERESFPALTAHDLNTTGAKAIVVLGHSRYRDAPEYGGDTLNTGGLARVRYAAWLHRRTGLPILAAGGSMHGEKKSEAQLMKEVLEAEFKVPVRWLEERSHNTFENARYAKELLLAEAKEVNHVLVVTHHRDMPRALWSFKRVGLKATAAPTLFADKKDKNQRAFDPLHWVPSPGAAVGVRIGMHELLGQVWYWIRH